MYRSKALVMTCILLLSGVMPLTTGKSCEDYSCPEARKRSIDEKDAALFINSTEASESAANVGAEEGVTFKDGECPPFETSEREFQTPRSSFWVLEDNHDACHRFACGDLFEDEENTFGGISVPGISYPYQANDFDSAAISNDSEDSEGDESDSHRAMKRHAQTPTNVEDLPQCEQGVVLYTIESMQFLYFINYDSANIIATTSFAKYGSDFYKCSDIEQVEKFAAICQHFGLDYALSVRIGADLQTRYYQTLFQTAFANPCVKITEGQAAIVQFLGLRFKLPIALRLQIALAITVDYGYKYLSLNYQEQRRVIENVCESFGMKCKKKNRQVADEMLMYFRDVLTPLIASKTPVLERVAADPKINLTIKQLSLVQLLKFRFNIDFKVAIQIAQKITALCQSDFSRLSENQRIQTIASICREDFGLSERLSVDIAVAIVIDLNVDVDITL